MAEKRLPDDITFQRGENNMEGFFLIVGIFVLVMLFMYWQVTLILLGIGVVIYFLNEAIKKDAAKEALRKNQEAEQKAVEKAKQELLEKIELKAKEDQENTQKEIVKICYDAVSSFEKLPLYLDGVKKKLNEAEANFSESAFGPFWDSIQNATYQLGSFDDIVRSISRGNSSYLEKKEKLFDPSVAPSFPIAKNSIVALSPATSIIERYKSIVRKAQCNFQFAQIYEQRMTNQILVAGFKNLAQAIDGMGSRISSSITSLSQEVADMSSSFSRSIDDLKGSVDSMNEFNQKEATELEARHNQTLTMLNNIQYAKVPSAPYKEMP